LKRIVATLLLSIAGLAGAQPLLEFREDLAFSPAEVAAQGVRAG